MVGIHTSDPTNSAKPHNSQAGVSIPARHTRATTIHGTTRRAMSAVRAALSASLSVLGCTTPSPQSTHVSSPETYSHRSLSTAPLTAASLERRSVPAQSLSLMLPEGNLWRARTTGTYYHATHSETASELWVKRWRQGQLVNPERCAAQAGLWRPELAAPNRPSVELASHTSMQRPAGYHTDVKVHVWADATSWRAQLTASGASIRECFSYVYTTRAPRSPLGRAIVAQRLQVMQKALAETEVAGANVESAPRSR